jgi:hypothetical protein
MRSLLATLAACAIAAAAVAFAVTHITSYSPPTPPAAHANLPPSASSYLGVYERGSPPSYDPVADFAALVGRQPNLVGYYSGWAEPFQTSFADAIHDHRAIPYVQIDPTLASVSEIAEGADDVYLRAYADSVRDYGHAVVIGFGHEMNAPWYAWGYGHVPATTFVAAWRHIITVFRDQGTDNVTWLWTINADVPGTGPVAEWWPGASYVTWVGIDGYYYRPTDTFATVFGRTIDQVRKFTDKPVLLSETAVGPHAGQFVKIANLFAGMLKYKTLGLVWYDNDQLNGTHPQDWKLADSPSATIAFRLGLANLTLTRS